MRKRYKKKLRSCRLCKPNKRGITKKYTAKEEQSLKIAEKEIRQYG